MCRAVEGTGIYHEEIIKAGSSKTPSDYDIWWRFILPEKLKNDIISPMRNANGRAEKDKRFVLIDMNEL